MHVAEQREREAVLLREGRVDERVVAADGQQRRPALPHGGRGLIQAGELGVPRHGRAYRLPRDTS